MFFDGEGEELDGGLDRPMQRTITALNLGSTAPPVRYPTGVADLDVAMGGGMPPGMLGVLGAEDKVGKSSLTIYSAWHSSVPCGIVSTQDGPGLTGARLLAYATGFSVRDIFRNTLTQAERRRVIEAAERVDAEGRIVLSYASHPDAVLGDIERMGKRGTRLVWLDYIQAILTGIEETNNLLRDIQGLCTTYDMSCMIVSQLRKPSTYRGEVEAISRHMLKGTGNLSQDARVVLLMTQAGGREVRLEVDRMNWDEPPSYPIMFTRSMGGMLVPA